MFMRIELRELTINDVLITDVPYVIDDQIPRMSYGTRDRVRALAIYATKRKMETIDFTYDMGVH